MWHGTLASLHDTVTKDRIDFHFQYSTLPQKTPIRLPGMKKTLRQYHSNWLRKSKVLYWLRETAQETRQEGTPLTANDYKDPY
jgi:hypothetical protein